MILNTKVKLNIDLTDIRAAIDYFRRNNIEQPQFLVMNITTAQILADDGVYMTNSQTDILASELYGIRVAVNNSLDDYIVKVVG